MMLIKSATYISSCVELKKCPKPSLPEYAFIGRSNVGKSSLINMITGIKGLAKVSASPGKTRVINHFLINDDWYLVDLPGYGFARISKDMKSGWDKMISGYLLKRQSLICTFILIDVRIPVQANDLGFINNMGESQLPFIILLTKCDKVSKQQMYVTMNAWKKSLSEYWQELPVFIPTSAKTAMGRDEILNHIGESKLVFTNRQVK